METGAESTEALLRSRAIALERYHYYLRLLGQAPDSNAAPDTLPLDRRELTEENFDEAYAALVGQYEKLIPVQAYPQLRLVGETSPANQSGSSGQGRLYLNTKEDLDLNEHAREARGYRTRATDKENEAQGYALIPDLDLDLHYWGIGSTVRLFGGTTISTITRIEASSLNTDASLEESRGVSASKTASHERRADDWILQSNLKARGLL